jgi:hypothetical protein
LPSSFVIDISFPVGILFPDVISLNFSMIVDPYGERAWGKGPENSTVVMFPICRQYPFEGYPISASDYVSCGGMATNTIVANVPGNY